MGKISTFSLWHEIYIHRKTIDSEPKHLLINEVQGRGQSAEGLVFCAVGRMQHPSFKLALSNSAEPLPFVPDNSGVHFKLRLTVSLFQCVFQLCQQVSPESWTLQRSAGAIPESY